MKSGPMRVRTPAVIQQRARELRQEATPAEETLWQALRGRRLGGRKFRRQHPLGPFIADFCCPEARLIVEVDGSVHDGQGEHDAARTQQFETHGYRVVRVRNEDVLCRLSAVLKAIAQACDARMGAEADEEE